jgi:4-amino-4-deoxy-L-arabinose transferase-like glycosyltransferase
MTTTQPQPRAVGPLVLLLFAWIVAGVTLAQWRLSPTFDEQNHVTRGIAVLRTGDFRLCYHHPPLANILSGLAVAWLPGTQFTMRPEYGQPQMIWPAARATLWARPGGAHLIRLARLPMLLFALLLGAVIFLWARELFSPWGGVFALALYAVDPNMLAHAGLATTDIACTATIALAVYLLRRHLRAPGRWTFLAAGVGIGLALAAKFTGLILLPIAGLLLLFMAAEPWGWTRLWRVAGRFVGLLALAGITVWAVYGFQVQPLGSKPDAPLPAHYALPARASLKDRLPVPAMQYLRGLKAVSSEAEGHRAYLLGQSDTTGKGWWYYFPVAIAVKTPLPELLAILGMLVALCLPAVRRVLAVPGAEWPYLLIPAGAFLLAASGVLGFSLNLGIRHLLPLYPLLLVMTGGWAVLAAKTRRAAWVPVLAVVLQLVSILAASPDWLSYFNEAAGGSAGGYRILADSNFDWGQDLESLAAWQRRSGVRELAFSYFGSTPPDAVGVHCRPLAGFGIMDKAPAPDLTAFHGYLAVSATNLVGGAAYTGVDYQLLLRREPIRKIGRTIFIYQL